MEATYKVTLFLDKRELGVLQPDRTYGKVNHSDWHITFPMYSSNKLVDEYVQTYLDPFRTTMTRQAFNPYFIEYGFFENIQSYSASTEMNPWMHNIELKAPLYNIKINK
jgi:hypothetical protein